MRDAFPLIVTMQQLDYNNGNGLFPCGPCRDVKSKEQSQFSWVLHAMLWAREVEEFPLLQDVARERLTKIQQAGKRLRGCCGDLWIVEISGGAVVPSCVYKWSVNPNPVYSYTPICNDILCESYALDGCKSYICTTLHAACGLLMSRLNQISNLSRYFTKTP
jgi:hypothetical protein